MHILELKADRLVYCMRTFWLNSCTIDNMVRFYVIIGGSLDEQWGTEELPKTPLLLPSK